MRLSWDAVHCTYDTHDGYYVRSPSLLRAVLLAVCTCDAIDGGSAVSSTSFFKPSTCPMSPPGFGKGHSRFGLAHSSASFALRLSSLMALLCVSSRGTFRRLLRRGSPDSASGSAESARMRGSTGQGSRCGVATTRKETMRVVVKSDVVMRDRGCRCGGMVTIVGAAEALRGCRRQREHSQTQVSGRTSAIEMPAECGEGGECGAEWWAKRR